MSEPTAPQPTSRVYVIGSPGSNVAKIGTTLHLQRRLQELQPASPVPLAILVAVPGGRSLERALHKHFATARSHNEWFDFGDRNPAEAVREALTTVLASDGETVIEPAAPPADPERERAIRRSRLMPRMGQADQFRPDPKGIKVASWPSLNPDAPYYLAEESSADKAAPRCRCGHQIGGHDRVRPHACAGSCPHPLGWSDCLCLGYEGPLPEALADYDLPGHNWRNWKTS